MTATPADARDEADPAAFAGARRARTLAARLRNRVRAGEGGLIVLAVVVGLVAGLGTTALSRFAAVLHLLLYGHAALSAVERLDSPWLALVPAFGGLLLGAGNRLLLGRRRRRPVDPIEANALTGGRMSLLDSLIIGAQTLASNGFGASVGLEAGYTQLGSGFASALGRALSLRRADLRMMVGAGAAGAIAAAFGAPLTGAFYGFEIIIGTYTPFGLAPVIVAAIAGVLVARTVGMGEAFIGRLASDVTLDGASIVLLLLLSLLCAAVGVAVMRGVTLTESLFRRSKVPIWLQPALGGLGLGGMALVTPHALSAGHGALASLLHGMPPALGAVALTLLLKCLGSAISIGSGFRGGLFFASLYIGGLTGMLFHGLAAVVAPGVPLDAVTCAVVGMAGMSVTIIGGPLTMSFLALEATGDFTLSVLILATTTLDSVIVRRTFGYSFATWRLHLRGESIRSAQDVGWIRSLTVERLMRRNPDTVAIDRSVGSFLQTHPIGGDPWVVAIDVTGRYAGMVSLHEAHTMTVDEALCKAPLRTILRHGDRMLTPGMNAQEAARVFQDGESEALAVVDDATTRRVLGQLTEAHLLRRYTTELDRARRDLSGEGRVGDL